jgi:hypothetical protein
MLIPEQVKHLEAEFHAAKLPTNPAVDWSDDSYERPYQKREITPPPPPSPPPDASLGPDAEPPAQASLIDMSMLISVQPRGAVLLLIVFLANKLRLLTSSAGTSAHP